MCFSATASFSAAGVLGVLGYLNTKLIKRKKELFIALVPFVFAFQQLVEGSIWLAYADPQNFQGVASIAKYLFLLVAIFIWPVWISLSLYTIEDNPARKKMLAGTLALGILYDCLMLYEFITSSHLVGGSVVGHSIQYQLPSHPNVLYMSIYSITTILPFFISTFNKVWILGIFNIIGLYIANYFYTDAFISVWCFFATFMSIGLYFILKEGLKERKEYLYKP